MTRRIAMVGLAAMMLLLMAVPVGATPAEVSHYNDDRVGASFNSFDGIESRQVSVGVGDFRGGMGDLFYVNLEVCRYSNAGVVCWIDTNTAVVDTYRISPAGATIDADVEIQCFGNGCAVAGERRWVHLVAEWRTTEVDFTHRTDVVNDPVYGKYTSKAQQWSDLSPDVAVSIDPMPINFDLPELQRASFTMNKGLFLYPQP